MDDELTKTLEDIRTKDEKIGRVAELVTRLGGIEGQDHKQWLLDQTMRTLLGPDYQIWRSAYDNQTEDGERTAEWDEGRCP